MHSGESKKQEEEKHKINIKLFKGLFKDVKPFPTLKDGSSIEYSRDSKHFYGGLADDGVTKYAMCTIWFCLPEKAENNEKLAVFSVAASQHGFSILKDTAQAYMPLKTFDTLEKLLEGCRALLREHNPSKLREEKFSMFDTAYLHAEGFYQIVNIAKGDEPVNKPPSETKIKGPSA